MTFSGSDLSRGQLLQRLNAHPGLTDCRCLPGAADRVFWNLSYISQAEYVRAGVTASDACAEIKTRIKTFGGHAILDAGRAIALYGFVPFPKEPGYATWFVCTRPFFDRDVLRNARFCRDRMTAWGDKLKGPIIAASSSPHPDAQRWLKLLGFEKISDHSSGFVSQFKRDFLAQAMVDSEPEGVWPEFAAPGSFFEEDPHVQPQPV